MRSGYLLRHSLLYLRFLSQLNQADIYRIVYHVPIRSYVRLIFDDPELAEADALAALSVIAP